MKITLAHSPDSDDAFMHYAITERRIDCGRFEFESVLADIESLNRAAVEGRYEVTALSIHAYAHLHERYALLNHGASMGEGYGPVVVARGPLSRGELAEEVVAIPGTWTSAALALRLWQPEVRVQVMPFDRILDAVLDERVAAGVLIHEAQLTYREAGLHAVVDLGAWWHSETGGLPLPLGGNAIRRDLGEPTMRAVSAILRASIAHALAHREEALDFAERFGRGLNRAQADRFVGMYVNPRTLDYGDDGRTAVREFLRRGADANLVQEIPALEFIP
ncbi:MAG: ABC transporter substrate-binding protein [Planctomycetes bacterium]|nr:ABC transporter substrate-binding protein [Planctomycetota bacterium]